MDVGLNSFKEICWARSARISECKLRIALTEDVKVEQTLRSCSEWPFQASVLFPREDLALSKIVPTPVKWLPPLGFNEKANSLRCQACYFDTESLDHVPSNGLKRCRAWVPFRCFAVKCGSFLALHASDLHRSHTGLLVCRVTTRDSGKHGHYGSADAST